MATPETEAQPERALSSKAHAAMHESPVGEMLAARWAAGDDEFLHLAAQHRALRRKSIALAQAASDYAKLVQVEQFRTDDIAVHRAYEALLAALADIPNPDQDEDAGR